jgi:hypothetical protein
VPELVVRALEAEPREHGLEVGQDVAVVGGLVRRAQKFPDAASRRIALSSSA